MSNQNPPVNPRLLDPAYRAAVRQYEASMAPLLASIKARLAAEAAAKQQEGERDDAA